MTGVTTAHNDYARTVDQYGTTLTDQTLVGQVGVATFGPFDLRAFNGVAVTIGASALTIGTGQVEIIYMSDVNGGRDLFTRTFPIDQSVAAPIALRSPTLAPACRVRLVQYGAFVAYNADVWIAGLTTTPLGLLVAPAPYFLTFGGVIAGLASTIVYGGGYYAGDINLYLETSVAGTLQYAVQSLYPLGYQVVAQAVMAGTVGNVVLSVPAAAARLILINTGAAAINVKAYGTPAYTPPAT